MIVKYHVSNRNSPQAHPWPLYCISKQFEENVYSCGSFSRLPLFCSNATYLSPISVISNRRNFPILYSLWKVRSTWSLILSGANLGEGCKGLRTLDGLRLCRISSIIKLSTSDNAFRVVWLVHSILVISSYTLVWPYTVNGCAKRC